MKVQFRGFFLTSEEPEVTARFLRTDRQANHRKPLLEPASEVHGPAHRKMIIV